MKKLVFLSMFLFFHTILTIYSQTSDYLIWSVNSYYGNNPIDISKIDTNIYIGNNYVGDSIALVLSKENGDTIKKIDGVSGGNAVIRFSHDGKFVAFGGSIIQSDSLNLVIYKVYEGDSLENFESFTLDGQGGVYDICYTNNDSTLIASHGRAISFIDLYNPPYYKNYFVDTLGNLFYAKQIAISQDGNYLAVAMSDGNNSYYQIHIIDLGSYTIRNMTSSNLSGIPTEMRFSKEGYLITSDTYGRLIKWDIETGEKIDSTNLGNVTEFDISNDEKFIVIGDQYGYIHFLDFNNFSTEIETYGPTNTAVYRVVLSPDNRKLVSLEYGKVEFWNVSDKVLSYSTQTTQKVQKNEILYTKVYPNPFNPTTTIEFYLSENQIVNLAIYDINGRNISTLIDNKKINKGLHRYIFNAKDLSSGIYFYTIKTKNNIITKRFIFIK